MIRLFGIDIVMITSLILSSLLFSSNSGGGGIRAGIVMAVFIYFIYRIIIADNWNRLLEYSNIFFWITAVFILLYGYANMYIAIPSVYPGDGLLVLYLFQITMIMIVSLYTREDLIIVLKWVFCLTLLLMITYIIYNVFNASVYELAKYRLGELTGEGENQIIAGNSNTVAINACLLSCLAFFEVFYKKNIYYVPIVVIAVVAILFTGSKKGLFSIMLYICMYGMFFSKVSFKKIILILMCSGLILYTIFNNEYLYLVVGIRVEGFLSYLGVIDTVGIYDVSTAERSQLYIKAICLWLDNPLLGYGYHGFEAYGGYGFYSHNNYTELLCNFGLIGFVLYYSLPIYYFVKSYFIKSSKFKDIRVLLLVYCTGRMFIDTGAVTYNTFLGNAIFIMIAAIIIKIDKEILG